MKAFQFGKFVQVGNFKYALILATLTFLGENSTISPANTFPLTHFIFTIMLLFLFSILQILRTMIFSDFESEYLILFIF